ncbi:putative WD repeat-containing protein C2A9.03 [Zea mays]|uniref:Putative WD repeat-containing protein C2A9.03 n=1 Tax=Zea mays TaxID=4577 RepID=A0A317Y8A5_MAIZE|nr:putative WD repeat-containing protein C2A9.03 [Zea mays]
MSQRDGDLTGAHPEEGDRHAVRMDGSDDDELDQPTSKATEHITAMDVRKGKDMQGIPWNVMPTTRDKYRQSRLQGYANFENVPNSGRLSEKACHSYAFQISYIPGRVEHLFRPSKHLMWRCWCRNACLQRKANSTTSFSTARVEEFSVGNNKARCVSYVKLFCASLKHHRNYYEGFYRTPVSTLAVKHNLLVTGGFHGEIICKFLDRQGVSYCCKTTNDDDGITNSLEIFEKPSGSLHFLASNNDCGLRDFDMEKFRICNHFHFAWPVNHTSLSPDGKLAAIVGDSPDGLLIDANSGKTVHKLHGHLDYSFASAWNPDGRTFATGNQDKTCRVWDVRNLSRSVVVLGGNIGAVRSIRYTPDGKFMAMTEPADFIHIFDVESGYSRKQELDFFGEIAGISFSPDTEALFVGVHDRFFSCCLLQFNRRRFYSYLDSTL